MKTWRWREVSEEPGDPEADRSADAWKDRVGPIVGALARGFFGALFGAALAFQFIFRHADVLLHPTLVDWLISGAIVIVFALVAMRFGQEFWLGLADHWPRRLSWWRWWW